MPETHKKSHKPRPKTSFSRVIFVVALITTIAFTASMVLFSPLHWVFKVYGIFVFSCFFTRLCLSHAHTKKRRRRHTSFDDHPTITFGVPTMNEEDRIIDTILAISEVDYPKDKFSIIAINDGSTDATFARMLEAQEILDRRGVSLRIVNFAKNRGKRAGMAEIVARATSTLVFFVDSDTILDQNAPKRLVEYFHDPRTAAVAGHIYVANEQKNLLTRIQSIRYYFAFKIYKASESLFGSVTCCSGCCAIYRTDILRAVIDQWKQHKVMGIDCECGDDRSLTSLLLKAGHDIHYAPDAIAYTYVPETLRVYARQQMRWNKSWILEGIHALSFMWGRSRLGAILFYIEFILSAIAPFMILSIAIYMVHFDLIHTYWLWLFGLALSPIIQGAYYSLQSQKKGWLHLCILDAICSVIVSTQLIAAAFTLRNTKWGTRG